ncbi:sensor histidine kinase [Corynebacterium sp. CCUG 69979]|uniref:sensor histidine kinase n=1 Tax=Corynebacterium sp. CCUG 69979 TaxID=2823890 RepID=UPI00210C0806|nr:sensor histidine kinase [Corynebacterium sp. CCUG 69979]MCQ4625128.1 sensor histidine kinase [Corynebacterium sp. CCUG 69979]
MTRLPAPERTSSPEQDALAGAVRRDRSVDSFGADELIGWMFVPSLGAAVFQAVELFGAGRSGASAVLVAGVLCVAALVVLRQRADAGTARVRGALVLCILASLTMIVANVMAVPLMMMALTVLIVDVSLLAGIVAWVLFGVFLLVLGWWFGIEDGGLLGNLVSTQLLTGFGIALGAALADLERRRVEATSLAAEVQRGAVVEKELVLAQERQRAARELHDGLGHSLTLVGMSLEYADRMHGRDPEGAMEQVRSARALTVEALDEMRLWVRALNPVRSDQLRGREALDAIAESFRGTGVVVGLDVDEPFPNLGHAGDLLVLRFVQEGLTNALRHSNARVIEVEATACGDTIQVAVANRIAPEATQLDDGPLPEGFGLRSLRERAEDLGGTVMAHAEDGQVRLVLTLPYQEAAVS